jgi:MYXO-CTERM domain-containing protein
MRRTATFVPSLLASLLVSHAAVAAVPVDQEVWLLPGSYAAFEMDFGAQTAVLVTETPILGEDAQAAVDLAPAWIRPRLALTLSYLTDSVQDDVAALILGLDDVRALDELAFSIAASPPEDLADEARYGVLDLLVENALHLYEADPQVGFADLVETGEAGVTDDWSTTVQYRYTDGKSGKVATWTLPTDYYYRYVVNPKLDMELPLFLNPEEPLVDLADPPVGVFWRSWFMNSAEEAGTFDYRTHYLQETPNAVLVEDLATLPFDGTVDAVGFGELVVVVDGAGSPVLSELDWGSGTILASTIDLESAWEAGNTSLAENVALYAHRRDTLDDGESTLILVDPADDTGAMGATWAAILASASRNAVTLPWDEVSGDTLVGYTKVIVPWGSDARGYEELTSLLGDALSTWVSAGGTLLIQARAEGADEGGIQLPCNLVIRDGAGGDLAFEGHPVLGEVLAPTTIAWDLVEQDGLPGERELYGDETAMDAIGWWVSQNLFDNVSEYSASHGIPSPERSVWPERILHNHYGNCGEVQDMLTAAGRTALLPMLNVWSVEDHVWNEFYFLDEWHPYQDDWSDGPTRIDYGGVAYDAQFGGSKNVSSIKGFELNGDVSSTEIRHYSNEILVDVNVTDASGLPVGGASVVAWVENYYSSNFVEVGAWTHTDLDGHATLHLGDTRDFWIYVRSEYPEGLVEWPFTYDDTASSSYPDMLRKGRVGDPTITAADAVADASFSFDVTLEGDRDLPEPTLASPPLGTTREISASTQVQATLLDVPPEESFLGWYASLGYAYGGRLIDPIDQSAPLDFYVLNADAFQSFQAGKPFEALVAGEDPSELASFAARPDDDPLYLVVSNMRNAAFAQLVDVTIDSFSITPDNGDTADADGESGDEGCGCASGSPKGGIGLLILGLAAILGRRRQKA